MCKYKNHCASFCACAPCIRTDEHNRNNNSSNRNGWAISHILINIIIVQYEKSVVLIPNTMGGGKC